MKKIKYLLISLLLLIPFNIKAASVHCSAPATAVSGTTFTVKFYGSLGGAGGIWFGKIGSEGNASFVSGNLSFGGEETQNFSRTVTYKAGNPGSAKFYAYDVDAASDTEEISSSDTCIVTIVAATSNNSNNNSGKKNTTNNNTRKDPSKSNNTYLKSLNIPDTEITPEFNKDTLEYSTTVEGNIEKINIEGEAEDGKAFVEGLGEKELQEGLNEFYIYVTAENGDVKEYKLIVTRKEKNPIIVTIDGKKYTVMKKETDMELPEGYEKETITINEEEVIVYTNDKVGRTLVVLVDEENNKGFFIYDSKKDTYTEFKEFESKSLKILLVENPGEDIPFGYKRITFTINGQKVNGYYYKTKDKFRLVYGVNLETGDEGFYQYDMKQKTFQRYYGNQLKDYVKYGKYAVYCAGGLILLVLILFISTISLLVKNKKLKKNGVPAKEEKSKKVEKKEEVKEETKFLTRAERLKLKEEAARELARKEEPDEEIMEPSKRELKKQAKEKKKEEKRLAKEAKLKEKESLKEEPKESKKEVPDKTEELDRKELKRLQKEKERKLKEEADEFLR
ncbi:MAG: cadherin-like beta sandwich domain-containing protein [Bacilli bacterium]|nr:cadherin-like beta sandwich domain-containing protein [Bacilli bacterium]